MQTALLMFGISLTDAIPAEKAQSVSYQRASLHADTPNDDDEHENGLPSPRTNKVKRKAG